MSLLTFSTRSRNRIYKLVEVHLSFMRFINRLGIISYRHRLVIIRYTDIFCYVWNCFLFVREYMRCSSLQWNHQGKLFIEFLIGSILIAHLSIIIRNFIVNFINFTLFLLYYLKFLSFRLIMLAFFIILFDLLFVFVL